MLGGGYIQRHPLRYAHMIAASPRNTCHWQRARRCLRPSPMLPAATDRHLPGGAVQQVFCFCFFLSNCNRAPGCGQMRRIATVARHSEDTAEGRYEPATAANVASVTATSTKFCWLWVVAAALLAGTVQMAPHSANDHAVGLGPVVAALDALPGGGAVQPRRDRRDARVSHERCPPPKNYRVAVAAERMLKQCIHHDAQTARPATPTWLETAAASMDWGALLLPISCRVVHPQRDATRFAGAASLALAPYLPQMAGVANLYRAIERTWAPADGDAWTWELVRRMPPLHAADDTKQRWPQLHDDALRTRFLAALLLAMRIASHHGARADTRGLELVAHTYTRLRLLDTLRVARF